MLPGPEVMLAALIWALYLHDSMRLVFSNEGFLEKGIGGSWRAVFGTRNFTLLGKECLFLVAVPHAATFRLVWSSDPAEAGTASWESYAGELKSLQLLSLGVYAMVIVLFPLALLLHGGDALLLALIVTGYVLVAGTLALVWRSRTKLGLSNAAAAKLSVELLLCPAVAPNLPRKLSLSVAVSEDLVGAAKRLLAPQDWSRAVTQIVGRIDDEMALLEEGSARWAALGELKATLV